MLKIHPYSFFKYVIVRGALLLGGLFVFFILNASLAIASEGPVCPWPAGDYTLPGNYVLPAATGLYDCTGVNLTVPSGVTLTLGSNPGTLQFAELHLANLTIDSGGVIEGNGLGYGRAGAGNGVGPGAGTCSGISCGGGGHGGAGGVGSSGGTGGAVYGSELAPMMMGSAGGGQTAGGNGGGIIRIVVTEDLVVDGNITANAVTATSSAGGAGGSIYITTDTISGGGYIAARGANGTMTGGTSNGGGGGGRIAIESNDNSGDDITYRASGGIRAGSIGGSNGIAGTVLDGPPRVIVAEVTPESPRYYESVTLYAEAHDADRIDSMTIFLDSTDGGAEQIFCDLAAPETGTCELALDSVSAGTHQMIVRVVSEDTTVVEESYDFLVIGDSGSPAQLSCDAPRIELSTPNGGETLLPGSTFSVVWGASGCSLTGVRLSLSVDGGNTFDHHIADVGSAESGFYNWTVPDGLDSPNARLRAELLSGGVVAYDDSSADFTVGLPIVTIPLLPPIVINVVPEPEPVVIEPTPALIFEPAFIPPLFYAPPVINVIEHQEAVIEAVEVFEGLSLTPNLEQPIVFEIQNAVLDFNEAKTEYNQYSQEMSANINVMTQQSQDAMNAGDAVANALAISQLMNEFDLAMAQAMLEDGFVPDEMAPELAERISALQTEYDKLDELKTVWSEQQDQLDEQIELALEEARELRALEDESVILSDITVMYASLLAELQLQLAEVRNNLGLAEQELKDAMAKLVEQEVAYDAAAAEAEIYLNEVAKIEHGKSLWDPIFTPEELAARDAWQEKFMEANNRAAAIRNEINTLQSSIDKLKEQIAGYESELDRLAQEVNEAQMSLADARMITDNKINVATNQRDIALDAQQDVAAIAQQVQVSSEQLRGSMDLTSLAVDALEQEMNNVADQSVDIGIDVATSTVSLLEEGDPEYAANINACAEALKPVVIQFLASGGIESVNVEALANELERSAPNYAPCTKVALGKVKLVKLVSVYLFGEGNLIADTIDATFEHAFGIAGEIIDNGDDLFIGAFVAAQSGDFSYLQYAAEETVNDVLDYTGEEILPDVISTAVMIAEEVDSAIKDPGRAVQNVANAAVEVAGNAVNTVIKIFCLGPWC